MAAWDEDGTHIDPVTGKETQHKKGDLKLNENGTYYYESLDGRSVYGKRVPFYWVRGVFSLFIASNHSC
jgi:hypothetical protein